MMTALSSQARSLGLRYLAVPIVLLGCRGDDRHAPQVAKPGSNDPRPAPSPPLRPADELASHIKRLFDAIQSPDVTGAIAKLEAQLATTPEAERKLIERAIAILRSSETAVGEPDDARSHQLQIQRMRDTIALLEDMAALAPEDVDTITMVAASLHVTARNIESLTDEIPPRTVKQKARALADRLVKANPQSGKAWALVGAVAPETDLDTRLRGFARCVKFDPANVHCKQALDDVRTDYVRPYCEGSDIKSVALEWREVSRKPMAGATPVSYFYETYYVAPAAKFTLKDVVRIESGETTSEMHHPDGTVERSVLPTIRFELAPGKLDAMVAWSRALEKREDGYALLEGGKLLFIEKRALFDESSPGLTTVKIDAYCTKTKSRTLPAD